MCLVGIFILMVCQGAHFESVAELIQDRTLRPKNMQRTHNGNRWSKDAHKEDQRMPLATRKELDTLQEP